MAQPSNEWLKAWGSPRNSTSGTKQLEDFLDESGRYWSSNTPRSRSRPISRQPSAESDHVISQVEKPNIMTKVHEKTRKWKQILPYIRKHLHGQAHDNEKRHAEEHGDVDKAKIGNASVVSGDADYLGTPSAFHANSSYPRTLYESEMAPRLHRQHPTTQRGGSIMNSPPRFAPSQSRFALTPPQLTRCKSYRPRPGVKAGIEEVDVHDMVRTKSDPVRLKPVRLNSNEYQPTSFSFPTSPEIQELDDIEQAMSYNQKLDLTKYPSPFSPRFMGHNSYSSPQLVSNAHDNEPQASEIRLSNSRMVCRNNSNEMPFTDYNIIVEEINEILDSPSSLSSKAARKSNDFSEIQSAQSNHSKLHQSVSFPGPTQLNRHNNIETSRNVSANMWNNGKEITTDASNESPTHKILSEVAHKIAQSQAATNPELELATNNGHLMFSFVPTETVLEMPVDTDFNTKAASDSTNEMLPQANLQSPQTDSSSLDIKPINLKPIATKLTVDNQNQSSSNQDDYKTVTEAVTEILTPAYHAVSEAASKIVDSARIGTKKAAKGELDESNSSTGVSNDADYKTVTEAVGQMLTPVYSAVSQATKAAGTGYQKGISLRDYLKSKAVVGNIRIQDHSVVENEEVPNSPVPVSRNAYTEENEEFGGTNGRRLQEYTN